MENSTAVIITVGFLCILLVALLYRFLPRMCRRRKVNLQEASGGRSGGGAAEEGNITDHEAPRATPQLRAYNKRRFLASFPSLDRLLCHTLSWQEGITLESGLSSSKEGAAAEGRSGNAEAQENNNNQVNKDHNNHTEEAAGPGGVSAATQTTNPRVHSSSGILPHSILNMVSSIPSISIGVFSQSQSLPNVHGCLAESVSTPAGSRDLVVLWSTTLEGSDAGILTSTRLE